MEAVDPCVPVQFVPAGSRPVVKGADQPGLTPLPSIHAPSGVVITRWALSDEERSRVLRGEDVYIVVSTYGNPIQPLRASVGICDWSEL